MPDADLTLMSWFSPAYPVGAFAYSQGLETATAEGHVNDLETTRAWIADALTTGAAQADAVLLARAHDAADAVALQALSDLALALSPSPARAAETRDQGRAFAATTAAVHGTEATPRPYPVAIGAAARALGLARDATVLRFLYSVAANLTSAAQRLVPLGQAQAQVMLADLHCLVRRAAARVEATPIEDLGVASLAADLDALRHERLATRLFRS
ncbi:MAG: urease accessory UreF family protein [Pseudomonadota bacterium]